MTWPEVEQALAAGKTTAVLACGAVEQHGPHLPTCTDAVLGTAIAERAARIAGNALVAPTIRPGLSEHHMHFPGSFTLRPETFVAVIEDVCESLARQGFRRVVIFPSHGGNADTMKAHTPSIARPLARTLRGRGLAEGPGGGRSDAGRRGELGVTLGRAGVHAGYIETAMMLHGGTAPRPDAARGSRPLRRRVLPAGERSRVADGVVHPGHPDAEPERDPRRSDRRHRRGRRAAAPGSPPRRSRRTSSADGGRSPPRREQPKATTTHPAAMHRRRQ